MSTPSHSAVPRDPLGRTLPVEDGLIDDGALVPAPSVSREGAVHSSSFKPADHPKIALPLFRLPGDRQPRDTAISALRKQKHQSTPFFSSFPERSFQGFPTRRVKRVKKGDLFGPSRFFCTLWRRRFPCVWDNRSTENTLYFVPSFRKTSFQK